MPFRHAAKMALTVAVAVGLSSTALADTLRQAVEETVSSNPDVLIAAKSRLASDEFYKQARAGYYPRVDVNAGYGRERSKNPTVAGRIGKNDYDTLTRKESGVFLNQLIFDGFGTPSEVARRRADARATAHEVAAVAQDLGLEAAQAYMNVLRDQELVSLAKANVSAHRRTYKMIKDRSDSGLNREADVDQATGRLALAKANLQARQSELRDSKIEYLRIVGRAPAALRDKHIPKIGVPDSQESVVALALENHPRLHQAKFDVEEAEAAYSVAKSLFWPRVDAQVGGNWDRNVSGSKGTNNSNFAMLRMEYNVFNGGGDLARVREARYLIQRSNEVYNLTSRQVAESARLSWNDYVTARTRLSELRQHKESSRKTVVAYRKQFKLGKRSLLDLLDSENELFDASSAYTIERYSELFSRYRIHNSMGTLLQTLDVSLPLEAYDDYAHNNKSRTGATSMLYPSKGGKGMDPHLGGPVYSERAAPRSTMMAQAPAAKPVTVAARAATPVAATTQTTITPDVPHTRYASATGVQPKAKTTNVRKAQRLTQQQIARIKQQQLQAANQNAWRVAANNPAQARPVNVASNKPQWVKPQGNEFSKRFNPQHAAPTMKPIQQRKPVQTARADNDWNVQIGTFGNSANANRLVNKLRDKGYDAFIRSTSANGRDFKHVMVAPSTERAGKHGAETTLAEIEESFSLRGIITTAKRGSDNIG